MAHPHYTGRDRLRYAREHARYARERRREGRGPAARRRRRRGRYDEAYWPYGREFMRYGAPVPGGGVYPEHHWGGGVVYGLEGAGWAPFGLIGMPGYAYEHWPRRPRRPEESPAYGRDADRELQRWARRRGYQLGPPIEPGRGREPRRRRRRGRPRRHRR